MAPLRDSWLKLIGTKDNTKLDKLNASNAAWDICNGWIDKNAEHFELSEDDKELALAIENVKTLNLRLNKKISVGYTEDLLTDLVLSMDAYLIYVFLVAVDKGFIPSSAEMANPALAHLAKIEGRELIAEYHEATNLVSHLLEKYPY